MKKLCLIILLLTPSLCLANHNNVTECSNNYCTETDPSGLVVREWLTDGSYSVVRRRSALRLLQVTRLHGAIVEQFTLDFHLLCTGQPWRLRYRVSTSGKQDKTWRYDSQCKLTSLLTHDTLYTVTWKQDGFLSCVEYPIGSEPVCRYHPYW